MATAKSFGLKRGGLLLAASHLSLAALLSPSWVFSKYPALASRLTRGELSGAQVGDASPAYLLLHLALSPEAIRWLQWALAGASVILVFELLHRSAGPVAAWVGGGLLAFSQSWLVYSAVLEPDLLIAVALLVAVASLSMPHSTRSLVGAAVALGLATSLRPTAVVFAALVFARLALKRAPLGWGLFAVVVAALAPSTLLHLRVGHDVRGTMSAGQVFHQSHRPESVGFGGVFPSLLKIVEARASEGPHPPDFAHELYRQLARASDPSLMTDVDTERFWLDRAVALFRREPAAALQQELEKLVFFVVPPVGEYDIPAVQPLLGRSSGLPLRWLALLAAGALLVLRRPRAELALVWLLQWAAALVVGLAFYFHGRYAVGLVPALAGLAGLGVSLVFELRRQPKQLLVRAAAFPLPLLLLGLPAVRWADRMVERVELFDALTRRPRPGGADAWEGARAAYLEEQAALPDVFWPTAPRGAGLMADDPKTAAQAAERAVTKYGVSSPVDATLAAMLWAAAERCDEALPLAKRSSGFFWSNGDSVIDPHVVASDCLVSLGRRGEATTELEEANRLAPGRLEVLARLVAAGDTGSATDVARWEAELFELHDAGSAHYALARARRRWGDAEGSLADADWLKSHWPAAAPFADVERAISLVALRRTEEAVEAWRGSLVLHAPVHGQSALDGLVQSLNDDPASSLAHWRMRGNQERVRAILSAHPELAGPRRAQRPE